VAEEMIKEHPDKKNRFIMQKAKIKADDKQCLKFLFIWMN